MLRGLRGTRWWTRITASAAVALVACLGVPAGASADYNVVKVEFFAKFDESIKATDYYYGTATGTIVDYYYTHHTHLSFDEASDVVVPPGGLAPGQQIDNYAFPLVYDVTGTQDYTVTPTSDVPLDTPSRCSISYFGKTVAGGQFTAQQPPPVQIVVQQTAHGDMLYARAYAPFGYAWPSILSYTSTASGDYIRTGATCRYQGHYTAQPSNSDPFVATNLYSDPNYAFYAHPFFSAPCCGPVTYYHRTIKFAYQGTHSTQMPNQPRYDVTSGTIAVAGSFAVFDELLGANYQQIKLDALNDFPVALNNAITYCTPHALGLYGFGAGLLLIGGPTSPGVYLVAAGVLTAAATQPFCVATLKRLVSDFTTFEDPPAGHIGRVAKPGPIKPVSLPSCRRFHGHAAQSFCVALSTAERKWAQTAEQAASIDQAIETTISRETTAGIARKRRYVDLQDRQLPRLETLLRRTLRSQAAAGRAIAKLLASHQLGYRMSRTQTARTIAAIETYLSHHKLSTGRLEGQAGQALTPGPIDVLKALSGH